MPITPSNLAVPTTQPFDVECGAPVKRSSSCATTTTIAALGLGLVGAACTIAISLCHDLNLEASLHNRKLLSEADGCGEFKKRSTLTEHDKTEFKWIMVGEASAAGLGLLAIGIQCVTRKENCFAKVLMFTAFTCVPGGSLAAIFTSIVYGFRIATNGKCLSFSS